MTAPAPAERRHNPWLVLFALCLGFFMILLDTTIVNIAMPAISEHLNATLSDLIWVIDAYILVYAVLLITSGRLGDLYGPKPLFMIGLVIFTASSAACGFAQNPTQLIIFRVLQGLGGAMLTPQTLSVITMIFPADKRGAAFGVWGAVAGVATVTGPLLGGWLVTDYGWRWIFFVNVPVGVVALVMAALVMPNLKLNRRHRLDIAGVLMSTVALFLITFGLIEGQPHHWDTIWRTTNSWTRIWTWITIPEMIAAGAVLLAVFFSLQWVERHGEPLVPFSIFRDRNFSIMNFVAAAISFGMLGLFLPLTIFLQSVLGLTALQAGLVTAPMSLISMFVAPFAGRFADRVGGKWILFVGFSLFAIGMGVLIETSHLGMSRWNLLPGLIVAGFGMGMTFAPMQTVAMRNIQPRVAGAASGLINTTRQLGGVIGSAAVGALLQAQLSSKLVATAQAKAGQLPPQYRAQFVEGFKRTSGNLQVGTGQSGVSTSGAPEQIQHLAKLVFDIGYTNAMRVTLWLPIIVMGVAALSVILVRRQTGSGAIERADENAGAVSASR